MKLFCFTLVLLLNLTIVSAQIMVSSVDELKSALAKIEAGQTIVWKNGTYKDIKISFTTKKTGTQKSPIILKAETAGKVILTGNSQLVVDGKYLQAEGFYFEGKSTLEKGDVMAFGGNSSECRITNCAVKNYSPADDLANNNWISIQGIKNEVDHCYFSGKTNQGPYLVVRYKTGDDFVPGSDKAPSTYHHIHHNYFGYRTLPTDNGGEDMRIGDSKTSFTHGFNIIEYNYFEEQRLEPEVISNKSWDNIYRFNTFMNNDGSMVLRHGQKCFVYGNYFSGKTGRNMSGGVRVINPNQTVFNNYLEDLEGGVQERKAPICVMSGLLQSALNEYYPADSAIIAYNIVADAVGPAIVLGEGNASKGKAFVDPQNILLANNVVYNITGKNNEAVKVVGNKTSYVFLNNLYAKSSSIYKGFEVVKTKEIKKINGLNFVAQKENTAVINRINERLLIHHFQLTSKEIMQFNPAWRIAKTDVGVNWMK